MEKMTLFLNQKFGINPRGMWLAERVWEPGLPKFISNAGLDYVIVDDRHFLAAGLDEKDLYGYYLTDDQGKVIKVFPGSKELRYLIPFQVPEKTIEYLIRIREQGSGDLAMMGDDGEKFGIWPGTYKWVYEQKWLEHSTTIEEFSSLQYKEIGDFLQKPYSFQVVRDSENIRIHFSRTGAVNSSGRVSLSKELTIFPRETLVNVNQRADVWRFPIETASNSEAGFEKVYQGSALLFHWPLYLSEGEKQTYILDCWVREIS